MGEGISPHDITDCIGGFRRGELGLSAATLFVQGDGERGSREGIIRLGNQCVAQGGFGGFHIAWFIAGIERAGIVDEQ